MWFQIQVVRHQHLHLRTHCNDSAASEVCGPQVINHWCNSYHLSQGVPLSIIRLGSISSVLRFEIFVQFCLSFSILFHVNIILSSFLISSFKIRSSLKYKTLSYYKHRSYTAPGLFPFPKRRQSAKTWNAYYLNRLRYTLLSGI